MKFLPLFCVFAFVAFLTGCDDDDVIIDQVGVNDDKITSYLSDNNITATKHESGLYYTIDSLGEGPRPISTSIVTVKYKGYLLDGTVFDSGELKGWELTRFITGWQIAIPLLAKGGSGTFYIPSYYGYGTGGTGDIPGNSVLIFDIELLDFK